MPRGARGHGNADSTLGADDHDAWKVLASDIWRLPSSLCLVHEILGLGEDVGIGLCRSDTSYCTDMRTNVGTEWMLGAARHARRRRTRIPVYCLDGLSF